MIKATELRIGNYVYYQDDKHFYDVRAVCRDRVHPINIVEHDGNIRWAVECLLDDLSPIPLTPEILEGCGFVKSNEFERWTLIKNFDNSKYKELVLDIHKDAVYWWCIDDVGDNEGSHNREIEHLHQLQNLYFALTGKELEIKSLQPA